jgi:aldose sugar dehydrogenase
LVARVAALCAGLALGLTALPAGGPGAPLPAQGGTSARAQPAPASAPPLASSTARFQVTAALPGGTVVRTYKAGLQFPVDMDWVKGSRRVFFTEKNTGKIRVLKGRRLLRRACVDLDVSSDGEQGALGLVLHPRFRRTHWLYVYFTQNSPRENRVTRFTVKNNRCRRPKTIVRRIRASSSYHNGGQLEFVRGKLFISTGEAHDPARAQRRDNRSGKILRLNPDGTVPRDNPFGRPRNRNPVWSYGHRNPFGLTHEPGTRRLFSTENGPDCDDELNRIRPGRNYGWGPGYRCGTRGVGHRPRGPMRRWTPPIVPTDPWWYEGRMRALSGDLLMGDFRGDLRRFVFNSRRTRIRRSRVLLSGSSIVDVSKGPGGWVYFLTPGAMYRIVPS